MGLRRHRHDQHAGSEARPRGGALLRHGGDGHRLRSWHPGHGTVDIQSILDVVRANSGNASRLVTEIALNFPPEHEPCPIGSDRALEHAIITVPEKRDPKLVAKLDAVAGRVLNR